MDELLDLTEKTPHAYDTGPFGLVDGPITIPIPKFAAQMPPLSPGRAAHGTRTRIAVTPPPIPERARRTTAAPPPIPTAALRTPAVEPSVEVELAEPAPPPSVEVDLGSQPNVVL